MAQVTVTQVQANPPCHPDAEQREGVRGIPVGVKGHGKHRALIHCPECGVAYQVTTERIGRQVKVDWLAD